MPPITLTLPRHTCCHCQLAFELQAPLQPLSLPERRQLRADAPPAMRRLRCAAASASPPDSASAMRAFARDAAAADIFLRQAAEVSKLSVRLSRAFSRQAE